MIRWLVVGLLIMNVCWAGPTEKPMKAVMGIYPTFIHELDYADESYKISYYLWFITDNPNYRPDKSIEITNAFDYQYKNYSKTLRKDGKYLYVMHVYSTNFHDWKVANFPFDKQTLTIRVEDSDTIDDIVFTADKKGSALSSNLNIEDWTILNFEVKTNAHSYRSSLGDYDEKYDKYSQFVAELTIQRHGARLFFNFYIGFIVSILISSFVFFIEPSEIRPRASFTLAALFGAVGNKYIIDRYLPIVDHFTLNDAMQVASFGLILTTVLSTIITYRIQQKNPHRADTVNKYVGWIAVPLFILFYLIFFIKAIMS
ncbi:hypothetical protein [Legionella sp. W05-934-2]|uniref:hypothetical protein n=1 Tax=Legionella sp. W05-934-2 TaxID=1198649 RepID=UPI0034637B04